MKLQETNQHRGHAATPTRIAFAIAMACAVHAGGAQASTLNTGNPDVDLRWDNTVRYNAGWRMERLNPAFANSPGYDETEGRFQRGDNITNRVDLLSEIDMTYRGRYGFRVSAAAWRDAAYGDHSVRNGALPVGGAYANDEFNGYAKRYVKGPSGEILDAFLFGAIDLGDATLNAKVGKHNVYWGESVYSIGNSIAYSQGAIDTIKAATSPGVEAKELFLPRKQVSALLQLTGEFSVGMQYIASWAPFRLAPGGTYFSAADGTRSTNAANFLGGYNFPNSPDLAPPQRGDYGLMARWSPAALNGTVGLYYRKFDDTLPWAVITPADFRFSYGRDTELLGVSLTKVVSTVSVGAELSYRRNAALNSGSGYVVVPASGTDPTYAESEGARGNTVHGLLNGVYLLPQNALYQGGTLTAEVNFSHLASVTQHADRFYGDGYLLCKGLDKRDGCSTKNAFGFNVGFNPEWPQAFPGLDLSMPVSLGYQVRGNGAANAGGNEGAYSYAVGLKGKLHGRYDISLAYTDSYARFRTSGGLVSTYSGTPVQNNHGALLLTFKTTL